MMLSKEFRTIKVCSKCGSSDINRIRYKMGSYRCQTCKSFCMVPALKTIPDHRSTLPVPTSLRANATKS